MKAAPTPSFVMSSSLSPTARHSNRKHHSNAMLSNNNDDTMMLDDAEDQHLSSEDASQASDSQASASATATSSGASSTRSPSPSPRPSSSLRSLRQLEIPLSPPPLMTPPPKSPTKLKFATTTTSSSSPHQYQQHPYQQPQQQQQHLLHGSVSSNSGGGGSKGMEWKRLQPCTVARQDMASTVIMNETSNGNGSKNSSSSSPLGVLVVGGRSEELDLPAMDTVELFEWSSKRWRPLPSLNQARCGCAVAAVDKTFYVFGGVGKSNILEDTSWVETIEMGGKAWIPIVTSPMPNSRWHPSAVSLPFHEEIVVLGGRDPKLWTELATVHSFDTETHQWTSLQDMSMPRFACGATRLDDSKLLVCGGYNGTEWTASCELFDFTENDWSTVDVQDMPILGLQFVTATTLNDDFVLVSGQRDDPGEGGSVWMIYDIANNEWITLPVFPPNVAEEMVGCTLVAVGGKYILTVGGTDPNGLPTKNTRISTNLMTVLHMAMNGGWMANHDDSTVQSYRSGSTAGASKKTDLTASTRESRSHSQRQLAAAAALSPHGRVSSPWAVHSPGAGQQHHQSPYHRRGLMDSDHTPNAPTWAGPVSHIQLVDQGSSVISAQSGDSSFHDRYGNNTSGHGSNSSPLLNWSYEDGASEMSASTGVDSTSYQLVSPSGRPKKSRSTPNIHTTKPKRQTVHDIQIVDGNGMNVMYSGHVLNGRPSGKGRMVWENGDAYSGGFKHGQRHGKGCQSYSDGRQYEGRFVSNFSHDPNGSMTWKDGTLYVGAFVQGKRTGNGIQRFPSGVRYEGEFVNGKYHGHGICCFADGSMYNGEWIHGKAHGSGVLRDKHRTILFSGMWQNDSPIENSNDDSD